ncbi:MAG: YIP1 family protein [Ignavibacteriales bacterium]
MKNSVICPNCKTPNPFYNSICSNCKFYLREKISNLDLWSLLGLIVENPSKAFRTIIFSEHKNFIYFVIFFVSIKYLINARFVSMLSIGEFQSTVGLEISLFIVLLITLLFFLIFSTVYFSFMKLMNIEVRFRDIFAILIYSQVPFIFGLIILFSLELVIFGDFLFSINPTPFILKGSIAYMFLALEISTSIWSSVLVYKAFLCLSQSFSFSLGATFTLIVLLSGLIYIYSLTVFTL